MTQTAHAAASGIRTIQGVVDDLCVTHTRRDPDGAGNGPRQVSQSRIKIVLISRTLSRMAE